ncbi:MAG: penicillin-binding protein 2 [Patescibacteria group bacterium]
MDIFGNASNLKGDKNVRRVEIKDEPEFSLVEENEIGSLNLETTRPRLTILKIVTIGIFLIIASKLFLSQIVQGKSLMGLAEGNRIRPRVISATRGLVTDSSGNPLAKNVPTFDLAVYPSDLPKKQDDRDKVYAKLAEISGVDKDSIKKTSEGNGLLSLDEVVIKQNLGREEALIDEQKVAGLEGAFVAQRASRNYVNLPGLSHILGYTGKVSSDDLLDHPEYLNSDWTGKAGIEKTYDEYLKGKNGVEQIEVDSTGRINRVLVDSDNREPVSGDNVQLFLDSGLQQKSYEFLMQGIEQAKQNTGNTNIDSGVVIAMNPQNGAILSYVSVPYYDNNLFVNGISNSDYQNLLNDPAKPLLDRAVNGIYPPGSIIKIVMASAGLAEGSINVNTSFDTPPAITIGEWNFPDWKDHGVTNIIRAIAESNNIFFYAIGGGFDKIKGLGIDTMKFWWQKFGLGEETGIDLPSEASGLLPDEAWKQKTKGEDWYIGDTYHAAIGQGDLLVTPIQMARATATIANGGKLLHPQFVQKITDPSGNVVKEFSPRVENPQVAPLSVIKAVQEGMRMTITGGSATSVFGSNFPVAVAGKTGTAQFFGNQKTHAWFECYAPYDNPSIALIVLIEGGGGGNEVSAPVAKNILNYYFTR